MIDDKGDRERKKEIILHPWKMQIIDEERIIDEHISRALDIQVFETSIEDWRRYRLQRKQSYKNSGTRNSLEQREKKNTITVPKVISWQIYQIQMQRYS